MINIVGRRTVPQVFINGKHLGGSDGKINSLFLFHTKFDSLSLLGVCHSPRNFLKHLLFIVRFPDTVEAYESGHLHKLLGIETKDHDDHDDL